MGENFNRFSAISWLATRPEWVSWMEQLYI